MDAVILCESSVVVDDGDGDDMSGSNKHTDKTRENSFLPTAAAAAAEEEHSHPPHPSNQQSDVKQQQHRPLSPPPPPPLPEEEAEEEPMIISNREDISNLAESRGDGEANETKLMLWKSGDSNTTSGGGGGGGGAEGEQQQQQQQDEEGGDESVAVLIPHNFRGLTSYSAISSLNSSFRSTYDANNNNNYHQTPLDDDGGGADNIMVNDPDDILNLELVEDDDDTQGGDSTTVVELREPLHIPVALRELWLSPQQQEQRQQQILSNNNNNKPQYPTSNRASGTPSFSTSLLNNAYHEREDKVPVWPSRGRSICSEDSERIKAALNRQCFSQHNMSSSNANLSSSSKNNSNHSKNSNHNNNNNNNNNKNKNNNNNNNKKDKSNNIPSDTEQLQNSNNSSFPSVWEDSWSTFATLDNIQHAEVILEEGTYLPPPSSSPSSSAAATTQGVTPKRMNGSGGHNNANQNTSSLVSQQISHQQENLLGGGGAASSTTSNSKSKRSSMMANTVPPRRTNSRNSQYSSYSDNMSRSTMDASQIKRVSRNERISRLKRKSLQPPQQGSVGSLSPTQNFRKHHGNHAGSVENTSYASSSAASSRNSLSQNSQKPQRRPTKVLPRDEEAEAEPNTFFQHSESQLSLTSSEEEEEEYTHESDMTPRLPGRRSSVTSTTLYEEEQAAIHRNAAHDGPLSQPLRRNSTWGSTGTTINLEAHPETVEEEDFEESDDGDDNEEEEESVVRLVLSDSNRYDVPVATHHLMEDNNGSSSDNLPVSSIHLQDMQDNSDQNLTTSTVNIREMQDDSDSNVPSSIHLPPPTRVDNDEDHHQHPAIIKHDHDPAPPARTRSISRAVGARNQREWLKTASSATTEDLLHVRRPRGLPDFIPNKPKRQSTLTKEDLYTRLMGGAKADLDKDNSANGESKSKEDPSSSLSISSPSNTSGGNKKLAAPKLGHRRSLSGEAPHLPMRQVSRTSTVMSPALVALDSLSFHDSKEFLMLSNRDQDIMQESLSSHAGDFDFAPPQSSRSLQSVETASLSKALHKAHIHGSRGELTETSLLVELHPVLPHGELQNSSVSAATTHQASNTTPPGRILPVRHNTRGSSLRSAAASLQLRGSASSPHSQGEAGVKSDEDILHAREPMSPSTEFGELKKLNECTVQSLNEQLNSLQLGVTVAVASSENADAAADSLVQGHDTVSAQKIAKALLEVSEHSISTGAKRNGDVGTTSEQDTSLDALGCSNHSSASVWTSASKEFEHLKVMMNDDTIMDLETQLKMLEQLEADQNNDSTQDFDIS